MFKKTAVAILIGALSSVAMAFPTKVRLLADPDYRHEGNELHLRTNKGKVIVSHENQDVYAVFLQNARKGDCFVLETESDWLVEFNKALDESLVRSAAKIDCKGVGR